MELGSNVKREGKIKGSSRTRDPNPLCFWEAFLMPLKITLCKEMESDTGTIWSNFHVFTYHNEFRKENPHILASDSGADFEHGQTGWSFYCSFHFRSWWKQSDGVFKSCLLSFVSSGHCASESWERTKSHSSIPADFGREQRWRMKPFMPRFPILFLEVLLSFSKRSQTAR